MKENTITSLREIMNDQKQISKKARILYKAAAFAYIDECAMFLRKSIPNSFRSENFEQLGNYIYGFNNGKKPESETRSKYKLITWDLQGLLGLSKEPIITERGCFGIYKTLIYFKTNNNSEFRYCIEIPNIFDACLFESNFGTSFNEDYFESQIDSLNILISKFGHGKTVCEHTIVPENISTIKDVFNEMLREGDLE